MGLLNKIKNSLGKWMYDTGIKLNPSVNTDITSPCQDSPAIKYTYVKYDEITVRIRMSPEMKNRMSDKLFNDYVKHCIREELVNRALPDNLVDISYCGCPTGPAALDVQAKLYVVNPKAIRNGTV